MAINRYTFSNDLKAKDLCYSDEFFKLKSEKVIPSDSFSFDSYEALKNILCLILTELIRLLHKLYSLTFYHFSYYCIKKTTKTQEKSYFPQV
mgnify:CR=1 FL=1